MTFTSEKYKTTGNFTPGILKPDLRSCFLWFIALIILVGILVGLSILFGKD